jgi:hypothetical protein
MISQAVVRTGYMTLFPWYVPGGGQAYPHEEISNIIYDTFGLYTNFTPYTLASIGTALSAGTSYDGWTIGQTNKASPMCDEPTVPQGADTLNNKYRGYTYGSANAATIGYTFLGTAIHTNWMTKW